MSAQACICRMRDETWWNYTHRQQRHLVTGQNGVLAELEIFPSSTCFYFASQGLGFFFWNSADDYPMTHNRVVLKTSHVKYH